MTKRLAIATIVLAGTAAVTPIMIRGIPAGADFQNHYRFALPFYDSLKSGNLHPGWLAESNIGYGDTRFRFYPPGLYYLLSAARALTGWYSGTILTFAGLSILGGLGIYFWARTFCSLNIALLAGLLYSIMPYRLNELYGASLLSEYAACSILPFAFAFLERICRKGTAVDVAGLAASYALVILTHAPVTVIGSLSLATYTALRMDWSNFLPTSARLVSAVALGLLASAFFWTTVLAELPWIKGSSVEPNIYYQYRVNFVFSPVALTGRNTWYANILALVLLGFCLPALPVVKEIFSNWKLHRSLCVVLILGVLTFLMTTDLSRPLWAIIPKLREIQFPWRWWAITSMCGSILVAAGAPKAIEILRTSFRALHLVPVAAFLLALLFISTQIVWDQDYLDRQRFDAVLANVPGSLSFKDWLPIWASDIVHRQKMSDVVEAEARPVTINSWQPEHRSFQIGGGPAAAVRVRTYFYPHWKATTNGVQLATSPAQDGALLISIPKESTNIELDFREPRRVRGWLMVSGAAWILITMPFAFGAGNAALRKCGWQSPNRETPNVVTGAEAAPCR